MTKSLAPLFLSHGSPMTALEPREAGDLWQQVGPALAAVAERPRAILAISAHSLVQSLAHSPAGQPVLLAAAQHAAVHDFSGFPEPLYRLRYDAPGAPTLATGVAELVTAAGLPIHTTPDGGLDHGIWAPLRFIWPEADIPVLPLAFPPDWSPARLFALGQALAPLADEGVLVYASGSLTHNLRLIFGGSRPPIDAPEIPESAAFRNWFAERCAAADWPALLDYRGQSPHGVLMHPSDEHLLPFYVAAGAGGGARPAAQRLHASLTYGCLAMDAYAFGPAACALAAALAGQAPVET